MKQMTFILLTAAILGCKSGNGVGTSPTPYTSNSQESSTALGSCKNPILIQAFNQAGGEMAETGYVKQKYPGFTNVSVRDASCNGKAADRVRFTTPDGKKVTLFFDKSGWAGKP